MLSATRADVERPDGARRGPAADRRPVVLLPVGYYPPAYRAGGPTRSVPAIVRALGDRFDFRVVTRDRDLGATEPLPGVRSNRWVEVPGGRCLYLGRARRLTGRIAATMARVRPDILYVNSLFSAEFSVLPLLLRRLGLIQAGLVVAPRGELEEDALALKPRRKGTYLRLARALGLFGNAVWQAAHEEEAARIRAVFGATSHVGLARDMAEPPGPEPALPAKEAGELRLAFVGRISPMKNLDFAIEALGGLSGTVVFDVYGPIEDEPYWQRCLRLAAAWPATTIVRHHGAIPPAAVATVLAEHHLFLLPSRGESFGHAIVEALLAGRPVVVSDETPWRGLAAREAGWDLPLGDPSIFTSVLQEVVDMPATDLARWCRGARRLGVEIATDPALVEDQYRVLEAALPSPSPR